jgi:transposase
MIHRLARRAELTDEPWTIMARLMPKPPRRADGRGRPWRDAREGRNGLLGLLRRGARWPDLPARFPP